MKRRDFIKAVPAAAVLPVVANQMAVDASAAAPAQANAEQTASRKTGRSKGFRVNDKTYKDAGAYDGVHCDQFGVDSRGNPIADSLTYIDGSAFGPGAEIQFSVDGGQTYASRDELTVTENGETRQAAAEDLTHVRWVMQTELAAGAQGMARFAAVLE